MIMTKKTKERMISMFEEIVTEKEINSMSWKKYINLYVFFGCMIMKLRSFSEMKCSF